MSKRVIFWVAVGAVVLIALTAFVWSYQHNRDAEYKAAIKAHAESLRLIGVAHHNEALRIAELEKQAEELNGKILIVNRSASSGLADIRKWRKDWEARNAEIADLSDADLDRIIADGIAKYKRERGQDRPRPTD